jgi:prepilin-type N-terminal cleavage/methylation domain-containing protein
MDRRPGSRGFTLIEILCVLALMVMMMALGLPALSALTNQAGRKAAVNQILGAFEQARIAALESGANVYLVFGDKEMVDSNYQYRSFVIMREPTDEESGVAHVALTKWQLLPKGVSFSCARNTLFDSNSGRRDFTDLPSSKQPAAKLPYVTFSSSGAIIEPTNPNYTKFLIYEGSFDATNLNDAIRASKDYANHIYDTFRMARFTGRLSLESENFVDLTAAVVTTPN